VDHASVLSVFRIISVKVFIEFFCNHCSSRFSSIFAVTSVPVSIKFFSCHLNICFSFKNNQINAESRGAFTVQRVSHCRRFCNWVGRSVCGSISVKFCHNYGTARKWLTNKTDPDHASGKQQISPDLDCEWDISQSCRWVLVKLCGWTVIGACSFCKRKWIIIRIQHIIINLVKSWINDAVLCLLNQLCQWCVDVYMCIVQVP